MKKIVLYGAGKRGRGIYQFLQHKGYSDMIYCFCDKKAKEIEAIEGKRVMLPEELRDSDITYCITLLDGDEREIIRNEFGIENCIDFSELPVLLNVDRVEFNRDFCAFYHNEGMDSYFEKAEKEVGIFWDFNSEFYKMFQKLDISNVIELGCGRGRHVVNYIDKAENITLVDILQKNINICKERYKGEEKIKYYKNDGYDLKELAADAYSALYSYDAMVHFELLDINSYLRDIYRVLKEKGRVLLHHSNYHADYRADFSNAPGSRSFMSKECFAYLAYRAGFEILEQKVIDWNGVKELDCVTLLEKRK